MWDREALQRCKLRWMCGSGQSSNTQNATMNTKTKVRIEASHGREDSILNRNGGHACFILAKNLFIFCPGLKLWIRLNVKVMNQIICQRKDQVQVPAEALFVSNQIYSETHEKNKTEPEIWKLCKLVRTKCDQVELGCWKDLRDKETKYLASEQIGKISGDISGNGQISHPKINKRVKSLKRSTQVALHKSYMLSSDAFLLRMCCWGFSLEDYSWRCPLLSLYRLPRVGSFPPSCFSTTPFLSCCH